jgi:hypothetical protein
MLILEPFPDWKESITVIFYIKLQCRYYANNKGRPAEFCSFRLFASDRR